MFIFFPKVQKVYSLAPIEVASRFWDEIKRKAGKWTTDKSQTIRSKKH